MSLKAIAGVPGPPGPPTPPTLAQVYDAPAWSALTTYGAPGIVPYIVTIGDNVAVSLQADNLNHSPNISPLWWQVFPDLPSLLAAIFVNTY